MAHRCSLPERRQDGIAVLVAVVATVTVLLAFLDQLQNGSEMIAAGRFLGGCCGGC